MGDAAPEGCDPVEGAVGASGAWERGAEQPPHGVAAERDRVADEHACPSGWCAIALSAPCWLAMPTRSVEVLVLGKSERASVSITPGPPFQSRLLGFSDVS